MTKYLAAFSKTPHPLELLAQKYHGKITWIEDKDWKPGQTKKFKGYTITKIGGGQKRP